MLNAITKFTCPKCKRDDQKPYDCGPAGTLCEACAVQNYKEMTPIAFQSPYIKRRGGVIADVCA